MKDKILSFNTNTVRYMGIPIKIAGELPAVGSNAPDFVLTKADFSDVMLKDFAGCILVLNIFPGIEVSICSPAVKKFNVAVAQMTHCNVLCVSLDLLFTQMKFCNVEGIKNIMTVSELKTHNFGDNYGLKMLDGPFAGFLARSVIIIDWKGAIAYTQLVPEINGDPDYAEILDFIKSLSCELNYQLKDN